MFRIINILFLLIILLHNSCNNSNKQPQNRPTQHFSNTRDNTIQSDSYSDQSFLTAYAESGAVIVGQKRNGDKLSVKYRKKCNYCGRTSNTTTGRSFSKGMTISSSYYCRDCKKTSKVKIHCE